MGPSCAVQLPRVYRGVYDVAECTCRRGKRVINEILDILNPHSKCTVLNFDLTFKIPKEMYLSATQN